MRTEFCDFNRKVNYLSVSLVKSEMPPDRNTERYYGWKIRPIISDVDVSKLISCQINEPPPLFSSIREGPKSVPVWPPRFYYKNDEEIEIEFGDLYRRWIEETVLCSTAMEAAIHPAYQRIIGMGRTAVPLILRELAKDLNHWFWALSAITGVNPVLPENRGRLEKMKEDWLIWGQKNGFTR
ncbi:MAG: hypothetical protein WA705_30335 [Candidatus Ozemobacteraceae bacterium]